VGIWQDWTSYRRFRNLAPRDRNLVFYSETHQDWHHLQPLIALIAGILILLIPRLLNFIVAVYLIVVGITGLFPNLLR